MLPVLNGAHTISAQLDALAALEGVDSWELVVADNGCTDDTSNIVNEHPIRDIVPVRVVDARHVRGVNHARNCGVRAARGAFIAICDADDMVDSRWLATHVEAASRADQVVTAGPLDTEKVNPSDTRAFLSGLDQPSSIGGQLYGWGANMGFHRSVFDLLSGFDESFIGGFDEIEFMYRARQAGIPFVWVPEAICHYRLPSTWRAAFRRQRSFGRMSVHFSATHVSASPRPTLPRTALRVIRHGLYGSKSALRHRSMMPLSSVGYQIGILEGQLRGRMVPQVPGVR